MARSDRSGPIELLAARYPVIRRLVGEANSGDGMIERWVAEAAIVARPLLEVEVRRLPPGGYAFLRALSDGQTLATAVEIATEVTPKFGVVSSLRPVDNAKVVVGIQEAA